MKGKRKAIKVALVTLCLIVIGWFGFLYFLYRYDWYLHHRRTWSGTGCAGNMRTIGIAIWRYVDEHQGEYPPNLAALYKEGYIDDLSVFVCNRDPGKKEISSLDRIDQDASYLYLKPTVRMDELDPSWDIPILYEKRFNHKIAGKYQRGILFGDKGMHATAQKK